MPRPVPFRRSVFFRLFLVMVVAAVGIIAIVAGLFATVVGGSLGTILHDPGQHARIASAHNRFLGITLLLVVGVVVLAHEVIRHSLKPLRSLRDAVERMGAGDVDVVLPEAGRADEFGALTDAFNAMARRVREMLAARDRLLRDVSHELRSPLTRMKVALALLPEGRERSRMEADAAEMERLVQGLLELERLRDGRALRLERRDLVPLLAEAAEAFRDEWPGVVVSAAGPLEARVDADGVRTVLRNLLENAAKVALPESAPVRLSAARDADAVVVRVSDDGPGVPEPERASLFEPFFRVDRSRSRRTGGYGLGLSICKGVMEAHGGTIAFEPSPGRGATFVLRFPAA